jgi:hypothetical protein
MKILTLAANSVVPGGSDYMEVQAYQWLVAKAKPDLASPGHDSVNK